MDFYLSSLKTTYSEVIDITEPSDCFLNVNFSLIGYVDDSDKPEELGEQKALVLKVPHDFYLDEIFEEHSQELMEVFEILANNQNSKIKIDELKSKTFVYLKSINILEKYQNNGLGEILFSKSIEHLRTLFQDPIIILLASPINEEGYQLIEEENQVESKKNKLHKWYKRKSFKYLYCEENSNMMYLDYSSM
ncbi:hypothetical protein H4J50_10440 [Colwellia sp. 6M3]|uniref:hypothetical protein n=1 Tax=Colwellia sp. 6M3 TaxID=2759849 RepID=UPI0015F3EF54|nr:hypothetical protein [Colwellia sp. 6M3]MBA6416432.1 hypothetical protein [Colwellia sp. 6M3]